MALHTFHAAEQIPSCRSGGETQAGDTVPAEGLDHLLDQLADDTIALFVRQSGIAAFAGRVVRATEEALGSMLPERCRVAPVALTNDAIAVLVTPATGEPITPLLSHILCERLAAQLPGLGGVDAPVIVPCVRVPSVSAVQGNLRVLDELLDTIVNRRLAVQFQPIVNLTLGRVYGYEALARLPKELAVRKVGAMYEAADRARIVAWLDMSCHEKCVTEAARAGIREYLFLNMEAEGLAYLDEAKRCVGDAAERAGIAPERIVLEITEREAVEESSRVMEYVRRIRDRGVKIAIDDAGQGYSSLQAIMEMRPDFVKVSRQLVRGIHASAPRRALLEALTGYAAHIGSNVIAEGIETRDELATVMDIGVGFGQGYLFARPKDHFRGLRQDMHGLLIEMAQQRTARRVWSGHVIGSLAREGTVARPEMPLADLRSRLAKDPEVESVAVVEDGSVVGLAMRYHVEQFRSEPAAFVRDVADRCPLTVEADSSIEETADRAAFRRQMCFQDDVVVTLNGRYLGCVSMRRLLAAISRIRLTRDRHSHPLTGLPGQVPLEQEIAARAARGNPVCVLRARVAGLGEHNARFGFQSGDELLRATAGVLIAACRSADPQGAFVAHTGGASFHALVAPSAAEGASLMLQREFALLAQPLSSPGCGLRVVWTTVTQPLPDGFAATAAILTDLERQASPEDQVTSLAA